MARVRAEAADPTVNLVPGLIEAARSMVTVGGVMGRWSLSSKGTSSATSPPADVPSLMGEGVAAVLGPGASNEEVVAAVRAAAGAVPGPVS